MATSGSKDFELDVADYVEEAFERCGLELRTGYDLKSAQRSLNLLLAEWANRGLNQWTIREKTIAMVKDSASYTIDSVNPTATIDVLDVFIRETLQGTTTDVPLSRMSRAEYSHVATKSTTGKPNQYFMKSTFKLISCTTKFLKLERRAFSIFISPLLYELNLIDKPSTEDILLSSRTCETFV